MDKKPIIPFPVIVEGKYDKIKLDSLFYVDVFTTEGFGVFRREDKAAFFRLLAKKNPLIILTDSDGAGLVIRNYFHSILPADRQIHLYTPEIQGKEHRKVAPSKAGKLGVEGIDAAILRKILMPYTLEALSENTLNNDENKKNALTSSQKISLPTKKADPLKKADLFALGLSGGSGSAEKRKLVAEIVGLPSDISSTAFLTAINLLFTREEFIKLLEDGNS